MNEIWLERPYHFPDETNMQIKLRHKWMCQGPRLAGVRAGVQECLPKRCEGSQAQQLDPAEHSPTTPLEDGKGWGGAGGRRGGELLIQLDRASGAPGRQICLRELSCLSLGRRGHSPLQACLLSQLPEGHTQKFLSVPLSAGC